MGGESRGWDSCVLTGGGNSASSNPLSGLRWELPGLTISGPSYTCVASVTVSATCPGDSAKDYNARLRFRGVVELKSAYTGGVNDGQYFSIGGTPSVDNGNVYSLTCTSIAGGAQTYYLNRQWAGKDLTIVWAVDYVKTIPMQGGSLVTLTASSIDSFENQNKDGGGNPVTVAGVPPYPGWYYGQFIQMDVDAFASAG